MVHDSNHVCYAHQPIKWLFPLVSSSSCAFLDLCFLHISLLPHFVWHNVHRYKWFLTVLPLSAIVWTCVFVALSCVFRFDFFFFSSSFTALSIFVLPKTINRIDFFLYIFFLVLPQICGSALAFSFLRLNLVFSHWFWFECTCMSAGWVSKQQSSMLFVHLFYSLWLLL